jgi:hypothetical protein
MELAEGHPERVAMVGHRHNRLAEGLDLLDERLDLIRTVQETELGMEIEMNELRRQGRNSFVEF